MEAEKWGAGSALHGLGDKTTGHSRTAEPMTRQACRIAVVPEAGGSRRHESAAWNALWQQSAGICRCRWIRPSAASQGMQSSDDSSC